MTISSKFLPWIFVGLACVLLTPYLVYGTSDGQDLKFHVGMFLSYRDAVEVGSLYPRWLPDQLHGLGSPALMIYPPMASAFFVLIDFLTLHLMAPERLLGFASLLLSIASALTFYLWSRSYSSARIALIASLFYATAPYHLNIDLYARAALAEYTTFVWIPLIFLGIRKTILTGDARGAALLALSIGALFLTHLLTTILIAPLALAYTLVCLRTELHTNLRTRRFMIVVVTAILGVGLAAFYFVPAVLLLPDANSSGLYRDVATTTIFHGRHLGIKPLVIACAYLLFSIYLLTQTLRNWRKERSLNAEKVLVLMWSLSCILCFVLMSGMFSFVFRPPSPYSQIQFAWRLLTVMEFSLISLFACCLAGTQQTVSEVRLLKVGAVVLLVMGLLQCAHVISRLHTAGSLAINLPKSEEVTWRLASIEYFPIGADPTQNVKMAIQPFKKYYDASQPAFSASKKCEIVDATRDGALFTVHTIASESTPIMIQQFFFPGWKASDEHGAEIAVFRDERSRLASYMAPLGNHTVVIERFQTKQEHWGKIVSLVALVLLVLQLGSLILFHRTNLVSRR